MTSLNDRIENDFRYHSPTGNQPALYEMIRGLARDYAKALIAYVPEGRELSLALTNLEQVVFWANAGVARNPEKPLVVSGTLDMVLEDSVLG